MSSRSDIVGVDACGVRVVDRERVAAVLGAMPADEDVEQVADVFALLGDPNRLRLLVALLAGGEMCVCDLAASAGMSESATSHAVGTLAAGIVIILTAFERADSIASLIVVVLMLHAAYRLLRETGRILLEAAPEGYEPDDVITAITGQPGVAFVHVVHVWLITSGFPAPATRCAPSWSSSCASASAWTIRPCRLITPRMSC